MKRRTLLGLFALIPFLGARSQAQGEDCTPRVIIPPEVEQKIAEVLREGGQITGLSYSLPPSGRFFRSGEIFLIKEEERTWQLEE